MNRKMMTVLLAVEGIIMKIVTDGTWSAGNPNSTHRVERDATIITGALTIDPCN